MDLLIFLSIVLLMIFSTVLSSDFLGYFAIITIILTFVKLLVKPKKDLL
jgi:hypothetical protein